MTDIAIDGKIISIVTEPFKVNVDFATHTDDLLPASPTVIEPTGAQTSVLGLSNSSSGSQQSGFILSDNFEIGDAIEVYNSNSDNGSVQVRDTSNNTIISIDGPHNLKRARKVASGSGHDWFIYSI